MTEKEKIEEQRTTPEELRGAAAAGHSSQLTADEKKKGTHLTRFFYSSLFLFDGCNLQQVHKRNLI
jgi:hypothetical protein